ncbi:MAG: hypothetical protein QF412_07320 [Planctomycetota bacterium]|jgi:hypothetical protein|nr:hypothetical protein [Planctomycetota bacterium]
MTLPPIAPDRPSQVPPIFFGVLVTLLTWFLVTLLSDYAPEVAGFAVCCCGFSFAPPGAITGFYAASRDQNMTPGQGFIVTFIGVGLAHVGLAAWSVYVSTGGDELEQQIRRVIEETNARHPQLEAGEIDQVIAALVEIAPYLPILFAAIATLLAALCGMGLTALVRSGRIGMANQGPPPPA